ncbi:hypothetical protein [Halarcobacter sp.]|uniref:hypothetical protein n=1 Tax=Halarcobacter sp. TaxID=2321133 RepID=UPI0029F55350|nr:hypothetical protein [Halarcobacter sp.]
METIDKNIKDIKDILSRFSKELKKKEETHKDIIKELRGIRSQLYSYKEQREVSK